MAKTNYLGGGGRFNVQDYMMRQLMDTLFKDKTPEYEAESSTMGVLASSASSEAEFQKLDKVLDEYWKRNNSHGAAIEAKEVKQRADYSNRKNEFYQYKEAHSQAEKMLNTNYLISATDKDGGIQNITTNDVSSWTHERITEELGKVNRINDALGYAEKGYRYNIKDSPYTTLSIARDVQNYRDSLMSGLGIAVETDVIPKDDILLRMIVSGDTEGVKNHSNEQRMAAAERFKSHDSNIDSYEALLSKILSYENKSTEDWAKFIGGALMGAEGEKNQGIMNDISALLSSEGANLNYANYAQNIGVDLEKEYELRDRANKRHKEYTGKLYEDVGTEVSEAMENWKAEGYTLEIIDEDDKKTLEEDGALADIQEEKELKEEEKATPYVPSISLDLTPKGQERAKRRAAKKEKEASFTLHTDVGYPTAQITQESKARIKKERKVSRPVQTNNKSIQKLWNITKQKYMLNNKLSVSYKDFAESIIKQWSDMKQKEKLEYGSFENYMKEVQMKEESSKF